MEDYKINRELKCLVVFLMIVVEQIGCGPVGNIDSEDIDVINSVLKLFNLPPTTKQVKKNQYPEPSYSNLVNSWTFGPFYKSKFKSGHNYDNFDYPNFDDYGNDKNTGESAIPWLNVNKEGVEKTVNSNENEDYQTSGENAKDQKTFRDFGNEDESSSEEDCKDGDWSQEYGSNPQFTQFGYKINHGFNGRRFGYHHGFNQHHGFGHNHHFHHNHKPGCYFPFGDRPGRRHPPPRGPPPTAPPTIVPTTTNPPTVAPATTTTASAVSIDPRASTMASIVRTEFPDIDIRFG